MNRFALPVLARPLAYCLPTEHSSPSLRNMTARSRSPRSLPRILHFPHTHTLTRARTHTHTYTTSSTMDAALSVGKGAGKRAAHRPQPNVSQFDRDKRSNYLTAINTHTTSYTPSNITAHTRVVVVVVVVHRGYPRRAAAYLAPYTPSDAQLMWKRPLYRCLNESALYSPTLSLSSSSSTYRL